MVPNHHLVKVMTVDEFAKAIQTVIVAGGLEKAKALLEQWNAIVKEAGSRDKAIKIIELM